MPLWSSTDANTGSPKFTPAQFKLATTQANANTLFSNTNPNVVVTGINVGVFGIDTDEMQAMSANAARPAHAGWVVRTSGQGGRAGRVHYETLVAGGSITGDAEDTVHPDWRIVIYDQPESSNQQTSNAISFTVNANTVPPGKTLRYQWQSDGGPPAQTWANVANTGVFTNSNTSTLNISNNALLADNVYRVIVSSGNGATSVTSANVTISIY